MRICLIFESEEKRQLGEGTDERNFCTGDRCSDDRDVCNDDCKGCAEMRGDCDVMRFGSEGNGDRGGCGEFSGIKKSGK